MPDQMTQHPELQAREFNGSTRPMHALLVEIHADVSKLEETAIRSTVLERPTPERLDPCEQFSNLERLGQVIVGADSQSHHAVRDVAAGGQHQHGRLDALVPQLGAEFEPAPVGKHHIKQDHVEDVALQLLFGVRYIAAPSRLVSFASEAVSEK